MEDLLAACEPRPAAVRWVWEGDRRSPCGETWLIENAPDGDDPAPSPLRAARQVVRDLMRGRPVESQASLAVRPEGLPSEIWPVHLELVVTFGPDGWADPWLAAMVGLQREDPVAAASLVAWSAWDPDDLRRDALFAEVGRRFDLEVCEPPVQDACVWRLADRLAGEAGPPGRRDRPSDAVWSTRGARSAGLAGDWVGAWADWVAGDPARAGIVRAGAGGEPAAALWSGGTEAANAALRVELGLSTDEQAVRALLPVVSPVDGPGARAAAVVPWQAL